MQNHLDSSQRTFSSMLPSDPFGPPSHDFTMNNHSNSSASDFGHLLNSSSNHNHNSPINNNHLHHNNNHSASNNNNNNNNNNHSGGGGEGKPKKAPPPNGKKTKGRVKIKMEFIDNKLRRYTTFSKRKTGIMKKAYELSTLTGTQVMLLVASETGHVYTFATRKLQPMITSEAGKALIQTCLNSPDPPNSGSDTQRMSATGYEETELTYAADPNASDHGDVKDEDSDSMSCSDGEDPKEVPPLLPLTNGIIPPNFAALLASATAAGLGGAKGGLTIDNIVSQQQSLPPSQQQQHQPHPPHAQHGPGSSNSSSSSSGSSHNGSSNRLGSSALTISPAHQQPHHHHHHHHLAGQGVTGTSSQTPATSSSSSSSSSSMSSSSTSNSHHYHGGSGNKSSNSSNRAQNLKMKREMSK